MVDSSLWKDMQINDKLVIDTIRKDSKDTIYFKDKDSRFIWNNTMHAKQFGLDDPNALIGKTDRDFFPAEFADKARQLELEIMRTGKPVLNYEEALPLDEDNIKYYSASKYPLYDKNNEIVGTWGISRDITEMKKLELELELSLELLELLELDASSMMIPPVPLISPPAMNTSIISATPLGSATTYDTPSTMSVEAGIVPVYSVTG